MRQLGKHLNMQKFYPDTLQIAAVDQDDSEISFKMYSYTKSCKCPKCGTESTHKHGTYERKVQDLPILGRRTFLLVNAFEYQCDNRECGATTFAENIDGFLSPFGRMTGRLEDFICALALETSCECCARTLGMMNVKISGDTVIRLLLKRYSAQPVPKCGSTVGIDDFAFKKRETYGTVIVDEATHKPVAVLEGRDGDSLKEWLKQNKHVTTVARDRASAYAGAVREVLPDCMQIADRFHLHQNLMDAVHKALGREIPVTNAVSAEGAAPVPDAARPEKAGAAFEPPFKPDMADGAQAGPESGQVPEVGKKNPCCHCG